MALSPQQNNIVKQINLTHNQQNQMLKSQQSFQERTLQHDINYLLSLFNELDLLNQGYISYKQIQKIFHKIGIQSHQYQSILENKINDTFQFDDMLSVLGEIQVPDQPSIYILSFVKVLAQYRNKCIERSERDDKGLVQAKQIGQRIKTITKNELQRRKRKLLQQHNKIYQEMNRTQNNQFSNFEEEWKKYLQEFKAQTHQRMEKVKNQKIKELSFQSNKLVSTARRHSVVTSPRLRQLLQKKRWLVKEGKYADAIKINYMIESEKKKIQDYKEESFDHTLRRRVQSMKKKNESALSYFQASMNLNMNKLLAKKKEGEHLMQLRMKNLKEQAEKKLTDHLRGELGRLKAMFSRASR